MTHPCRTLAAPCFVLGCLFLTLPPTVFANPVPEAADAASNAAAAPLISSDKPGIVHVEGVIQDVSGGLLPGAKVHFAGEAGTAGDVVADATGSFRIDLPGGRYRISAVETGYQQVEQSLELHAGAQTHLTLTLKIEKNVETVTVTASDGYATTVQTTGSRVPDRKSTRLNSSHRR